MNKAEKTIAQIIVDITHSKVDKVYDYRIPEALAGQVRVGTPVHVPFGRGNRETLGFVVGLSDHSSYDDLKEVADIAPDGAVADQTLVSLAAWMKHAYGGTMNQALKTVLPVKQKGKGKKTRTVTLAIGEEQAQELLMEMAQKRQTARARLLAAMIICSGALADVEINETSGTYHGYDAAIDAQIVRRNINRRISFLRDGFIDRR